MNGARFLIPVLYGISYPAAAGCILLSSGNRATLVYRLSSMNYGLATVVYPEDNTYEAFIRRW